MKYIIVFFLATLLFATPSFAYPQEEFTDCVNSSKENPELINVTDESIKGFCDCALTQIFDKNKIDNLWMNACIRSNFKD